MPLFVNSFCPVPDAPNFGSVGSRMAPCTEVASRRRCSFGREIAMPTYRAYLIDEHNRVASYKPVEAESDAEALLAARQFADGCDVEVWHLDRKIGWIERAKK
jgi:hypothetical protein